MKTMFRIIVCITLLLVIGSSALAQDEKEQPKHHKSGHCDTTEIDMPGVRVAHIGDDSVIIYINKSKMDNFNFSCFPFCQKREKYRGHWAGIDLGFNGYVTPDFNMNFSPKDDYLNINTARSLMVNLNPFELNVNLIRKHFGFTTGIGFQLNNYYFTNNYVMLKDSATLVAFKVKDKDGNYVTLKQNKMFNSYITLPLLFEYQTNSHRHLNSFHITVGVIGGIRIGTYTKQVYKNTGQTYYLVDDAGNPILSYYVERPVVRTYGSYHLSPFMLDATLRIGWSHLNLWATCGITQLFQDGKGPEVFPLNIGLTLLSW